MKVLKSICDIISLCLTNIINRSLITGVFPDSLKNSRITPIPKECDKCNLSNYRPISVLPIFSKVFEKVAYTQLHDYLGTNSILLKSQLLLLLKVYYSGNIVFSLFLDFRKAFDCVNHEITLSKLNTCGVPGITSDWFRSYLTNREHLIRIYKQCKLKP